MKLKLAVAGAALASITLTACGGDNTDAYCTDLEAAQEDFETLNSGGSSGEDLDETFQTLRDLAASAPEEISEEWAQLDDSIEQVQTALDEAGISFEDLTNAQSGELPEGVELEDLQALAEEFQQIGSEETRQAAETIEEHAREECDVDLS